MLILVMVRTFSLVWLVDVHKLVLLARQIDQQPIHPSIDLSILLLTYVLINASRSFRLVLARLSH